MDIVEDMLTYVDTHQVPESLSDAHESLGSEALRGIVIEVLGWLKSQHRMQSKRPLALKAQYTWCQRLADWLRSGSPLSNYFAITDDGFDFRQEVGEQERNDIRAMVDAQHQPRLMT